MSTKGCKLLVELNNKINEGANPEDVIPYSTESLDRDDYIELLYYAKQVLPSGRRKQEIEQILERETSNVSR